MQAAPLLFLVVATMRLRAGTWTCGQRFDQVVTTCWTAMERRPANGLPSAQRARQPTNSDGKRQSFNDWGDCRPPTRMSSALQVCIKYVDKMGRERCRTTLSQSMWCFSENV